MKSQVFYGVRKGPCKIESTSSSPPLLFSTAGPKRANVRCAHGKRILGNGQKPDHRSRRLAMRTPEDHHHLLQWSCYVTCSACYVRSRPRARVMVDKFRRLMPIFAPRLRPRSEAKPTCCRASANPGSFPSKTGNPPDSSLPDTKGTHP